MNTKISVPIKYGDGTSEISFLKFTNNSEDSVLNRGLELSLDLDLSTLFLLVVNILFFIRFLPQMILKTFQIKKNEI